MSENSGRQDETGRRVGEKISGSSDSAHDVDARQIRNSRELRIDGETDRGHGRHEEARHHHRDRDLSPPLERKSSHDYERESRYESHRDYRDYDRDLDRRDHRDRYRHRERGRSYYESRYRRRSPSRSPSPIIDFANRKRWTGWDQTLPRFFQPASFSQGQPYSVAPGADWINHSALPAHLQAAQAGMIPNITGSQIDYQHSQQAKQQRRLYLGNLPPIVVNSELVEFLNNTMKTIPGIVKDGGSPVVGIDMASDRNYAFLELRSPDEATYMTALDGVSYKGYSLRIRRPREWQPTGKEPSLPCIPISTLGIVSTTVVDSPNKIFIGGLPPHFVESDVKELLTCVGPLKAFNLVRDTAGNSKFAFCEYVDPELTDVACKTLNGQVIGDRKLVVQRSAPTKEKEQDDSLSSRDGFVQGAENSGGTSFGPDGQSSPSLLQRILTSTISTASISAFIAAKAMSTPETLKQTNILALINALDFSDEWTDSYYESVCEDMHSECSKYGQIKTLLIPRAPPRPKKKKSFLMPGQLSESDIGGEKVKGDADRSTNQGNSDKSTAKYAVPPGFGRIFIEYETVEEATRAKEALSGRNYDGRSIISSFVQSLPSS